MKTKFFSFLLLLTVVLSYAQSPFMTGFLQVRDILPTSTFLQLNTSVSGANSNYNVQYSTISAAHLDVAPTNSATVTITPAQGFTYAQFNLTSLTANTKYYYRFRATTATGFAYTGTYSFSTTSIAPTGTFPQEFNFNDNMKNVENSISFYLDKEISFVSDRHGNPNGAALLPNGATGIINNLPVGNSPRSVSIWIKPTSFTNDNIAFVYGNNINEEAYGFSFSSSTVFNFAWNTNVSHPFSFPLNQWTHIVTTYDAAKNAKIYINGALVKTQNMPNWNTAAGNAFALSQRLNSQRYFDGAVDDLKIFNTALTQTEITNLFTNNAVLGISENFISENSTFIYPNPAKDFVNIQSNEKINLIEIYSMDGRKILTAKETKINISGLKPGVYLVNFVDAKNNRTTQKLIIE